MSFRWCCRLEGCCCCCCSCCCHHIPGSCRIPHKNCGTFLLSKTKCPPIHKNSERYILLQNIFNFKCIVLCCGTFTLEYFVQRIKTQCAVQFLHSPACNTNYGIEETLHRLCILISDDSR